METRVPLHSKGVRDAGEVWVSMRTEGGPMGRREEMVGGQGDPS
jgi:hypothetical protein